MTDKRVFINALVLGFSPSAADSSKTSLNVVDRLPMIFDFGPRPKAWHDSRGTPTVFDSEADAREKVDDLVSRCKGIVRVAQKLGRPADIGRAAVLFGKTFDGQHFGGYEVTAYAEWEAMRGEEERVDSVVAGEALEAADAEARAAQEKADLLRAETPSPQGDWAAVDGKPGIQQRRKADGSVAYRARKGGKTSPSFGTIEGAEAWVTQLEALADKMVRS